MIAATTPGALEVALYIAYYGAPDEDSFGCRRIDAADPGRFVESTLAQTGPVCCTMQGVFAVSLGGVPWNGDYDQFVAGGPLVPYYDVNALSTAVDWLKAVTRLVEGAETAIVGPHDDEGPTHFFRPGPDQVYFYATGDPPEKRRTSLRELARQMLRESDKLLRFSEEVLSCLRALDPGTGGRCPIRDRVDEITGWQIERVNRRLRSALEIVPTPRHD